MSVLATTGQLEHFERGKRCLSVAPYLICGAGPIRHLSFMRGVLHVASGSRVYSVAEDLIVTDVGEFVGEKPAERETAA